MQLRSSPRHLRCLFPAFRTPPWRGAQVIPTPLAQPQLPPPLQPPPRTEPPVRRREAEKERGEPKRKDKHPSTAVRIATRLNTRELVHPGVAGKCGEGPVPPTVRIRDISRTATAKEQQPSRFRVNLKRHVTIGPSTPLVVDPKVPHPQPHRRQTADQRQHADAREQSAAKGWHGFSVSKDRRDDHPLPSRRSYSAWCPIQNQIRSSPVPTATAR
ncbi:hypothetical protein BH09PLA1_BH09PLA1_34560 [soil metagenome]